MDVAAAEEPGRRPVAGRREAKPREPAVADLVGQEFEPVHGLVRVHRVHVDHALEHPLAAPVPRVVHDLEADPGHVVPDVDLEGEGARNGVQRAGRVDDDLVEDVLAAGEETPDGSHQVDPLGGREAPHERPAAAALRRAPIDGGHRRSAPGRDADQPLAGLHGRPRGSIRPSEWRTAWKVLRLIWPAPGIALHRITARAGSVRTETDPPRETSRRAKRGDARRPGGQAGHAGVAHARVGGAEGEMAVGVDEDLAVGGAEEGEGEPERDRARVVVPEAERRPHGLDWDRHRRARVPGPRGGEADAPPSRSKGLRRITRSPRSWMIATSSTSRSSALWAAIRTAPASESVARDQLALEAGPRAAGRPVPRPPGWRAARDNGEANPTQGGSQVKKLYKQGRGATFTAHA